MPALADKDGVIGAFRLGWAMAEFRGRIQLGPDDPAAPQVAEAARTQNALPLSAERKLGEQLIETRQVLASLAGQLEVDVQVAQLADQQHERDKKTSERLRQLAHLVHQERTEHPEGPDRAQERTAWALAEMTRFLYAWDATIQDLLAAGPFGRASAYQIGRGLSEWTWALETEADPDTWGGWLCVLGEERRAFLQQLLDRLAPYFHRLTLPAMKQSLDSWHEQAKIEAAKPDTARAESEAPQCLRQQARRWKDLIVTGQDSRFPMAPGKKVSRRGLIRPLLKELWLQLSVAALGVVALLIAAYLLPSNGSQGGLAAVLGAVGITAAAVSARAKSSAQDLLTRARYIYDIVVAVEATTILPTNSGPIAPRIPTKGGAGAGGRT